jgi:cyclin D5, plant
VCSLVLAAASVLDYRPSTAAAAAVLAATHGALTKDAVESKMTSFPPAFILDKVSVPTPAALSVFPHAE